MKASKQVSTMSSDNAAVNKEVADSEEAVIAPSEAGTSVNSEIRDEEERKEKQEKEGEEEEGFVVVQKTSEEEGNINATTTTAEEEQEELDEPPDPNGVALSLHSQFIETLPAIVFEKGIVVVFFCLHVYVFCMYMFVLFCF